VPANRRVLADGWYSIGAQVWRRVPQASTTSGLILRGIWDSALCRQEVTGSIPVGWAKLLGAQTICSSMCRRSGSSPSLGLACRAGRFVPSRSHGACVPRDQRLLTGGECNITLDTLVKIARGLGTTAEALGRRAKL
jgi:hypothetical protein